VFICAYLWLKSLNLIALLPFPSGLLTWVSAKNTKRSYGTKNHFPTYVTHEPFLTERINPHLSVLHFSRNSGNNLFYKNRYKWHIKFREISDEELSRPQWRDLLTWFKVRAPQSLGMCSGRDGDSFLQSVIDKCMMVLITNIYKGHPIGTLPR
jgi:hypothetical protein